MPKRRGNYRDLPLIGNFNFKDKKVADYEYPSLFAEKFIFILKFSFFMKKKMLFLFEI